ncbi:hypothetical protein [Pelovirga terrestris]|nr:hypothetical protein [Pelovirga terrestris]
MDLLFFLSIVVIFCAFGVLNYRNTSKKAKKLVDVIRRRQP